MAAYPCSKFCDYSVAPTTRAIAERLVQSHYLHRWPGVVVLVMGMWKGPFIVGVVVFALPPRETAKRYKVPLVWELARLFINDSEPFNSETWFVARAIRYVKKNVPSVGAIVSYADPSHGHSGKIYKAGNWIEDGRTDQERKTPRFDYSVNGKVYSRRAHVPSGALITRVPRVSKFRFVMWLNGI
jgi:hypothetical protein